VTAVNIGGVPVIGMLADIGWTDGSRVEWSGMIVGSIGGGGSPYYVGMWVCAVGGGGAGLADTHFGHVI
jgi:hypothetical protein